MKDKILIIEDEIGIRESICLFLESVGFITKSAVNGIEGVKTAIAFKPDLIICDIMMPEMDGYDVLKTLQTNKKTSKIPFLFLTAKVDRPDIRTGMDMGADDYLFKPVDLDDLLTSINTRLARFEGIKAAFTEESSERSTYSAEEKIVFKTGDHSEVVSVKDIVYISADRQYSNVYASNKKRYILKRSLTRWEEMLPPEYFVRIHRSALINLNQVSRVVKSDTGTNIVCFTLIQDTLEISRRYLKNIKRLQ